MRAPKKAWNGDGVTEMPPLVVLLLELGGCVQLRCVVSLVRVHRIKPRIFYFVAAPQLHLGLDITGAVPARGLA